MRPLDRDELEARITPRVGSGRTRDRSARPIIIVATQCIEAGADFDFDVLVTECASMDSLRQRFGRLNRLGEAEACHGVVLMRSDRTGGEDPIYGTALAGTWEYLQNSGGMDFCLSTMVVSDPALLTPPQRAPVLLPAHLDSWVQTSPVPAPDPDVSLWLHGPEPGGARGSTGLAGGPE